MLCCRPVLRWAGSAQSVIPQRVCNIRWTCFPGTSCWTCVTSLELIVFWNRISRELCRNTCCSISCFSVRCLGGTLWVVGAAVLSTGSAYSAMAPQSLQRIHAFHRTPRIMHERKAVIFRYWIVPAKGISRCYCVFCLSDICQWLYVLFNVKSKNLHDPVT